MEFGDYRNRTKRRLHPSRVLVLASFLPILCGCSSNPAGTTTAEATSEPDNDSTADPQTQNPDADNQPDGMEQSNGDLFVFGATLEGAIEASDDEESWPLPVAANQRIFFDMLEISGDVLLSVELLPPDGLRSVFAKDGTSAASLDHGPIVLAEEGTYTLIFRTPRSETATYSFRVTAPTIDTGSISLAETVDGEILNPGDVDEWEFIATADDTVTLDVVEITGGLRLTVDVLAPDNLTVVFSELGTDSSSFDQDPFVLPESGTYTVVFDGAGDSTGTYRFQILESAP